MSKSFGTRQVLHDVSVDIYGGFTAIMGPTGCGKTTLLRMLARLDHPTVGEVRFAEPAGRVVLVPQEISGAVAPWLTVRKNLELAARNHPNDLTPDEVWQLVGAPTELSRYPYQLSGGQLQILAIAMAVAAHASLWLYDESFRGLDISFKWELFRTLRRIAAERNVNVIFVTHNAADAATFANRILILGGRPATMIADRAGLADSFPPLKGFADPRVIEMTAHIAQAIVTAQYAPVSE
ncbi:MAG: ATP-binding cassette domain-containing protein [Kiritimatiellae bacterium]|nr:ATP-binding cassette domain-containing protein [Kiritimatiellia bacterium]